MDKDTEIIESKSKRAKMCESVAAVNPLLINLVLEKVFPYLKGSRGTSWTCLKDYRLVCREWDKELVKMIRRDTEINLLRLISNYPDGLGWTESEEIDAGFDYECPYSVEAFENIEVTGNCENLRDSRTIRWFQVMGHTVKRLRFTSRLTCYHHVRFLECILKIWCRNLKALYLSGVDCIYSLVHNSKFVGSSDLICDLVEVTISVEEETLEGVSSFNNCRPNLPKTYLNFGCLTYKLVPDDPTCRALAMKILKLLPRSSQAGPPQANLNFISRLTGTDGGVLGQIFRTAPIEKLGIVKMSPDRCQDFLAFLNSYPIRIKETLRHFEFVQFPFAVTPLHSTAFRLLRFPLTTIRFGTLFAFQIRDSLEDLLKSYADTLEHLEFSGKVEVQDWVANQEEEYIEVVIPSLPKLKTFVNGNIFTCRMGGLDFLTNMPSLEKCVLTNTIGHSSIYPLTPAEVLNMLFQTCIFEASHPLKELRILEGKICYNNHVDSLQTWFPQLVKVELLLEGADVFVDFLKVAKNLNMEDVKVSFYSNDNEWCNAGIVDNVGKMTRLQYLQLIHLPDSPLILSAKTCKEGFAKARKLTSLKLTNFGMFADEMERIRTCLSHISCVQLSKTVLQYKPVDVEFSVGLQKSFPFAV